MIYGACDPGKTGSISTILQTDTFQRVQIFSMPGTEKDILGILNLINDKLEGLKFIIEAQHAFPGMSAKGQWSFAQHYGFIRGCLVSLGIPFIEVSPQKWMSYFGFKRLKDEDKKKHKLRILQKAQNLFPQSTVNLQTADSLMLCEYLRLTDRS